MTDYMHLARVRKDISNGLINLTDLVQSYLDKIEFNSRLNAFVEVYHQEALAKAVQIQKKITSGKHGKLAGMVIGIKDVFSHDGHKLQASSKILDGFIAQYNATVVQRLLDEDAIIIGRQNCDEFGMGSSNENSIHGPVRNALNENKVSGGSSGGSAVAVQAGLCMASIGSDTGGSIRQPAAFCGVIGLKPSYSRISRYGLTALASSFDCVGTIARSVEDTALLLEVLAGKDELDNTVSSSPVPAYTACLDRKSHFKIAVIKQAFNERNVSPSIKSNTSFVIQQLASEGHSIRNVDLDLMPYWLPVYHILSMAEASTNMARFDGIRYGERNIRSKKLNETYTSTRTSGFGPEVIRRIMLGNFILSQGHYEAYYEKAQKVRQLVRDEILNVLSDFDFILLPTTPNTAFDIQSEIKKPIKMYNQDIFTVLASLSGLPAISLPNGKCESGMPVGLQVIAGAFEEEKLLCFANYLMKNGLLV